MKMLYDNNIIRCHINKYYELRILCIYVYTTLLCNLEIL